MVKIRSPTEIGPVPLLVGLTKSQLSETPRPSKRSEIEYSQFLWRFPYRKSLLTFAKASDGIATLLF